MLALPCSSAKELVGRSYVGNDVTHSTLLARVCAVRRARLPTKIFLKYRSYRVSNMTAWRLHPGDMKEKICLKFTNHFTSMLHVSPMQCDRSS